MPFSASFLQGVSDAFAGPAVREDPGTYKP